MTELEFVEYCDWLTTQCDRNGNPYKPGLIDASYAVFVKKIASYQELVLAYS